MMVTMEIDLNPEVVLDLTVISLVSLIHSLIPRNDVIVDDKLTWLTSDFTYLTKVVGCVFVILCQSPFKTR